MNTKKSKQMKNQITDDLKALKGKVNQLEETANAKIEVVKAETNLLISKTKANMVEKKHTIEKTVDSFKEENKKIADSIKDGKIIF